MLDTTPILFLDQHILCEATAATEIYVDRWEVLRYFMTQGFLTVEGENVCFIGV